MRPGGKLALVPGVGQQLAITGEVLQSLEILRMPALELKEFVERHLSENPLLETETTEEPSDGDFSRLSIEAIQDMEMQDLEMDAPESEENDVRIEAVHGSPGRAGGAEGDWDVLGLSCARRSFFDMLLEEIDVLPLDEETALLCRRLIACLNRRGYFEDDAETLAGKCGCTPHDAERAVGIIQKLPPPGVGARSLRECLLLQLPSEGRSPDPRLVKLIEEGLPLLARNDLAGVSVLLGTDREEARRLSEVVKSLNPIPSQGYDTGEQNLNVIPEASVRYEGGACSIVMNDRIVPGLRIDESFFPGGLPGRGGRDEETGKYIRRKRSEAKRLIRALEDRKKTLLRILRLVVSKQPRYFREAGPLAPMKMSDLAGDLGLNVSTVSRAVRGKYIVCAVGAVELKSLFTAAVPSGNRAEEEKEALSTVAVKKRLKSCIENEDPRHPLSDENLRGVLCSMGANISRRTVTKYRLAMDIPAASLRRRT
ncbi:MAG: RNA polymerase factor sigma-54 [Synergistaceae bacterium]|jgi:RNA polymerase sigma-54 factor|nr:RNA polymerase factor sigma-54 [Synergistaceae bacterium]